MYSDIENKIHVKFDDKFRICSNTKMFTVMFYINLSV